MYNISSPIANNSYISSQKEQISLTGNNIFLIALQGGQSEYNITIPGGHSKEYNK